METPITTKDVIKDHRTGKVYWDTGIVRVFEEVLLSNVTLPEAKQQYPEIIDASQT